jgi:hypothetical protein
VVSDEGGAEVPLSDNEQRLLQQMEQALYAEDPKFAEGLRKPRAAQMDRSRFVVGVGSVILGLLILIAGVATTWVVVGILGFLVMVAGSFVAYRAWNGKMDQDAPKPEKAASDSGSNGSESSTGENDGFMDKMEDRWRKRKEQGGGSF